MRYFTNILRWISSQEHLYFLFGLLFIIPNCVFLFTEPLPVPVGLASIVMPLAFWMGVLLLARKPEWWSGVCCRKSYWTEASWSCCIFSRVGDSRGHVPESDKFECFRSKRIIRKYFSCHRLRLFLLYASYLVAGHAFNPHERQADCRVPQAVGVQKLGAFRSGGAALFPAFLAKA